VNGQARWRSVAGNQELLLLCLIGLLLGVVVVVSPTFFQVETLFNIVRGGMVPLVFAIGVLLVLISGGIDVSFLAIGIFAAYAVCKLIPADSGIPAFALFALAAVIGAALGLINAGVVLGAHVSTLIATLATSAIFLGALFAFVGGTVINTIPASLDAIGRAALITVPGATRGEVSLSVLIVPVIAVAIAAALFLRSTMAGRRLFAVGGDEEASRRTGFPVARTRVIVFTLAGAIAGLAGLLHVSLSGRADPTTFMGGELDVLAAVVLGGAAITGGKGSVRGVTLGVLAISLINAALIPLRVPPIWQTAVIGALLILGVAMQALSSRVRPVRPVLAPDDPALALTPGVSR
jgi:simple sugar transport system permease protein